MSKYYYKFPADSKEGKLLRSFHRAAIKAEQEAQKYVKKVGADAYYEDPNGFVGGVGCVVFKDMKKVNTNIWRYIGKQEENGDLLFQPNVIVTGGQRTLQPGETVPKDSTRRIWQDVQPIEGDGERTATYIDLSARATNAPKTEQARAVQAERWRLKLPIVRTAAFYRIVHADLSALDGTQAPRKVEESTPVFFRYHSHYFIGLDHPIHHNLFEEIASGIFTLNKQDMLWEARHKNELDDDE